MSYGRASGGAAIPVSFTCTECAVTVTLSMVVGKDYIFEETVRQAECDIVRHCNWNVDGHEAHCASCFERCTFLVNKDPNYRCRRSANHSGNHVTW